MFPTVNGEGLLWLTAAEMREVDRTMVEDLHIRLIQMMENAGRSLARLTIDVFDPAAVCVYAGRGGNGGGGLVAARHLANAGVSVAVALSAERETMSIMARHQLDILDRMGVASGHEPPFAPLALDCLIGYGLRGEPRGATAELIRAANETETVVALDVPSGLDATSGYESQPCIAAAATMTLASPKAGLRESSSVGDLYLADISVPPSVYSQIGYEQPSESVFKGGPLLSVESGPG